MKKSVKWILTMAFVMCMVHGTTLGADKILKMSTTTSTENSGRFDVLLPELEKGRLSKYGYSTKDSTQIRRRALNKAVKAEGEKEVVSMLNAQVILRQNRKTKSVVRTRKKFIADRSYVAEKYE